MSDLEIETDITITVNATGVEGGEDVDSLLPTTSNARVIRS